MNTLLKIIKNLFSSFGYVFRTCQLFRKTMPDSKVSYTVIIYRTYLNLENSLPNMVCMGIRNMRTPIPAKHDGPISAHNKPTTVAA